MTQIAAKFLPFHLPLIEEDDIRAVCEVMESGWITTGPKTVQFEQEFARFIGARHAVAVNSGTAALHVAFEAMGLDKGDEVVLPTLTFAATAEAVAYCKARPVLVDSEPDTFNLDPVKVQRAITPRTRAIVPVHFAGHPCDMARLLKIARDHGLKVIEDAAHALSARYRGRMVGTLGDMTCFSFYATKNITTGEGGMVTTANDEWADRMRIMRLHGISKDAWKRYSAEGSWRYEILAPGFKYNLTDMQAALGLSQLAKCQLMWARRSALAQRYTDALGALDAFEVPSSRTDVQHAWHLYVLRVCPGVLSIHRDRVIEELKMRGIGTSVHFIPLHLHPYYRDTWGYRPGDFPVAEDYFNRCISLPLYPAMSDEDQTRVIDALIEIAAMYGRTGKPVSSGPREEIRFRSATSVVNRHSGHNTPAVYQHRNTPVAEADSNSPLDQPSGHPGFYARVGKRILDVAGAVAGLLAAIPVLAVCATVVWLSSPGPILFRQLRIGRGDRAFELLKFRTMLVAREGPSITAAGDPRITSAGKWLRRWKLDELPQLINVLKGEMSLVGPRPEVPEYVAKYTDRQRRVLECKPGLTSPASLTYIDEEETLASQHDREEYYSRVLLPHKLEIDLGYCRNTSLATDLTILLATARKLLQGKGRNGTDAETPKTAASKAAIGTHATSADRC
ncbi:MAG: aminotransferase class I/II-fold pyridoxal phosphate-dependent enzyme [Terracidiphilus sp.]|jgi:dTDP-4-amino-4,6-dideoxygalactose transaminase/lipopolysaccharide/colanic/teichoic acid biosynthesis glycosyltransferase